MLSGEQFGPSEQRKQEMDSFARTVGRITEREGPAALGGIQANRDSVGRIMNFHKSMRRYGSDMTDAYQMDSGTKPGIAGAMGIVGEFHKQRQQAWENRDIGGMMGEEAVIAEAGNRAFKMQRPGEVPAQRHQRFS